MMAGTLGQIALGNVVDCQRSRLADPFAEASDAGVKSHSWHYWDAMNPSPAFRRKFRAAASPVIAHSRAGAWVEKRRRTA